MVFYHKLGEIPHKRHTAFRKEGGGEVRGRARAERTHGPRWCRLVDAASTCASCVLFRT